MEVIGKNGWGKIEFKFSVEINDDGNGATFSNDDGMFIHTDFEPRLSFDGYEIPLARLRELAAAEREGRVVVLPVAEGETAETPDGAAILNCWDIVARVTFCNEKRSHLYWKDKYADFDVSDIRRKE